MLARVPPDLSATRCNGVTPAAVLGGVDHMFFGLASDDTAAAYLYGVSVTGTHPGTINGSVPHAGEGCGRWDGT